MLPTLFLKYGRFGDVKYATGLDNGGHRIGGGFGGGGCEVELPRVSVGLAGTVASGALIE